MTLPTFLGIGAPRAGTTWLNTLLSSHPDVYTPSVRDEINFFDKYYERGLGWYEALFPPPEQADKYRAIGEVTPQYLACEQCPERIYTTLPKSKLIVMLRHPVDRAYSNYGMYVQRWNYRGAFEDFLAEFPGALKRGFYSRFIKRYMRHFDRSQILALLFEDAVSDTFETKKTLANFLEVAVDRFPSAAGRSKVNPSSRPRFQLLYGLVAGTGRRLRKWRLEPVVDFVMRTSIPRILAKGNSLPPLAKETKKRLGEQYQDDFAELERCLRIDLSGWSE